MVAMQKGSNTCGLYGIATAAMASNLQFKEDQMRNHLCKCLEDGVLSPFPTL